MKLTTKIKRVSKKLVLAAWAKVKAMSRKERVLVFGFLLAWIVVAVVASVPALRLKLENNFQSPKVTITAYDKKSGLPLIDASVRVGDNFAITNAEGHAVVDVSEYGLQGVLVQKPGYDDFKIKQNIKSKAHKLDARVSSTGKRVEIKATKLLSGSKVKNFIVKSKDPQYSAVGVGGRAYLVVPESTDLELAIEITSDYFLPKTVNIRTDKDTQSRAVSLVPVGKHYFLANRAGLNAVYSSDLDGGNQEEIIKSSGFEGANSNLYISPAGNFAIYETSRRQDSYNQLYAVNLQTKAVEEIDSGSPSWNIVSINDERVIYYTNAGNAADDSNQKLKTFNFAKKELKELHESRDMQFIASAGDKVVFAEQILRGSYPGGYLLRQLLAIDELSGEVTKLSEHMTITGVRVVAPSLIQYTQINPNTGAEVIFNYSTDTNDSSATSSAEPARVIIADTYHSGGSVWASGGSLVYFGEFDDKAANTSDLGLQRVIPERIIDSSYIVVSSGDGKYLVDLESGKSQQLP